MHIYIYTLHTSAGLIGKTYHCHSHDKEKRNRNNKREEEPWYKRRRGERRSTTLSRKWKTQEKDRKDGDIYTKNMLIPWELLQAFSLSRWSKKQQEWLYDWSMAETIQPYVLFHNPSSFSGTIKFGFIGLNNDKFFVRSSVVNECLWVSSIWRFCFSFMKTLA